MKYEELVARFKPKLKAITIKLDGKYTSFDDEDLYQEALLHLWDQFKRNELDDKTDSFILQGCYFFLKNYIRTVHKRIDQKCLSLDDSSNEECVRLYDVIPSKNREEIHERIRADLLKDDIIASLTLREKEIFSLSLEGFTIREIGNRLGISHVMVVKIKNKIGSCLTYLKKEVIESNYRRRKVTKKVTKRERSLLV
jgi:RNA polymerase sigma factor (sigma-70 family)